jgi:hypothetical protein
MAEIKQNFSEGKMNKDLDERLLPKGQYRHAENVQVSTTEESDVGALENIHSNTLLSDGFILEESVCVGKYADEKNNTLYWFIANDAKDMILRWYQSQVTPVLVDTNKNVLKFDPENIITGINVIDNLLFWTDAYQDENNNLVGTEPKKINIDLCMQGTIDENTHTKIIVPERDIDLNSGIDIREEHITVIKKSPKTKLELDINLDVDTTAEFNGNANPLLIVPIIGNNRIVGDVTYINGFFNFTGSARFFSGDELLFLANTGTNSSLDLPDSYQVKIKVLADVSGTISPSGNVFAPHTYQIEILEISPGTDYNTIDWFVFRKQNELDFFEKEFARFSYRYKYQDGEYSTFAPFSNIAFFPDNFDYETKKAYNLGMQNKLKSLKLRNFVEANILENVVQIDLLYKNSSSPNVYLVEKIKYNDLKDINIVTSAPGTFPVTSTNENNWTANFYDVTSDVVYAALPSNQIIRPFDNVPRKALAQEITGNRIVYGNYLQNYDLLEKPLVDAFYGSRSGVTVVGSVPQKSLKSSRNYQLGIVYLDEYGRQTPVFSSSRSSFKIPKEEAANSNSITFTATTSAPSWASFYKVYVKETSNEYYNLAMDRVYKAKDGNAWLSFPSSERNKIDEETFLILKKQLDADVQVSENLKYKVIAIEDNAPVEVKSNYVFISDTNGTGDIENLFTGDMPIVGSTSFQIDEATFKADGGPSIDNFTETIALKFKDTSENVNSDFYEISNIEFAAPFYNIKLKEKIKDSDKWIYSNFANITTFSPSNLNNNLSLRFYKDERKEQPEFDGKFFVKILNDNSTEQYVFRGAYASQDYSSKAYLDAFFIADRGADYQHSIIDNISLPNGTTGVWASSLRGRWANNILHFNNNNISSEWFIDQVYYAGKHPENNDLDSTLQPAPSTQPGVPNGFVEINGVQYVNSEMKPGFEEGYGRGIYREPTTGQWYMELSFSQILPDAENRFQNHSLLPNMPAELNKAPLQKPELFAVGSIINQEHVDQIDVVRNLVKNKIFKFVGDTENQKYIINDDVVIEKRYNYSNFAQVKNNFDQRFTEGLNLSGYSLNTTSQLFSTPGYNFAVNLERDWDQFSEAVNRRITYIIPFALHSDTPPVVNGNPVYAEADPLGNSNFTNSSGTVYSNLLDPTDGADEDTPQAIQFLELDENEGDQLLSSNPAIWETEPKENVDLDIYYEASECYDISLHGTTQELEWFNCYSFGNGVESDRLRDDFNQVRIDKGAIASSTIDFVYEEENRKNGLIYSGIYNSTSGINNLNQFIAAEKITKDINPTYGSIQKLFSRNTDLITFCEDKVIKILANKDAVFNADGNPQLIASQNVLGQTVPYVGDYGISKNPESFAKESYRAYFTDKNRGKVLRLSRDGITPISDYGMSKYFKDRLKNQDKIIGSYDQKKNEYNLTLNLNTISYDEKVKGWSSFKSFVPEQGVSVTNFYYTFKNGNLYKHHDDVVTSFNPTVTWNNFYGTQYDSKVSTILNDSPGFVKSFKTVNYEGSQSNVIQNLNDENYYNLSVKPGWKLEKINTDKEVGFIPEFIEKEGKWFNNLKGESISAKEEIDAKSFAFQGVGRPSDVKIIP